MALNWLAKGARGLFFFFLFFFKAWVCDCCRWIAAVKGWLRDVEMEQCEHRSHKGATSPARWAGGMLGVFTVCLLGVGNRKTAWDRDVEICKEGIHRHLCTTEKIMTFFNLTIILMFYKFTQTGYIQLHSLFKKKTWKNSLQVIFTNNLHNKCLITCNALHAIVLPILIILQTDNYQYKSMQHHNLHYKVYINCDNGKLLQKLLVQKCNKQRLHQNKLTIYYRSKSIF